MKILDPKAPLCMVGIKWSGVKGDELTSEMGRKLQAKLVSQIVSFYIENSSLEDRNEEMRMNKVIMQAIENKPEFIL